MSSGAQIDYEAIEKELSGLSKEDLIEKLVKVKARQIKTQKNSYDPEKSKLYRLKSQAVTTELVKRAKALGIYDDIMEQARDKVAQEVGEAEAGE